MPQRDRGRGHHAITEAEAWVCTFQQSMHVGDTFMNRHAERRDPTTIWREEKATSVRHEIPDMMQACGDASVLILSGMIPGLYKQATCGPLLHCAMYRRAYIVTSGVTAI